MLRSNYPVHLLLLLISSSAAQVTFEGTWTDSAGNECGSVTRTPGSSVAWNFSGTYIEVRGGSAADPTAITATLDGVQSPLTPSGTGCTGLLYQNTSLPLASHVLKLTFIGPASNSNDFLSLLSFRCGADSDIALAVANPSSTSSRSITSSGTTSRSTAPSSVTSLSAASSTSQSTIPSSHTSLSALASGATSGPIVASSTSSSSTGAPSTLRFQMGASSQSTNVGGSRSTSSSSATSPSTAFFSTISPSTAPSSHISLSTARSSTTSHSTAPSSTTSPESTTSASTTSRSTNSSDATSASTAPSSMTPPESTTSASTTSRSLTSSDATSASTAPSSTVFRSTALSSTISPSAAHSSHTSLSATLSSTTFPSTAPSSTTSSTTGTPNAHAFQIGDSLPSTEVGASRSAAPSRTTSPSTTPSRTTLAFPVSDSPSSTNLDGALSGFLALAALLAALASYLYFKAPAPASKSRDYEFVFLPLLTVPIVVGGRQVRDVEITVVLQFDNLSLEREQPREGFVPSGSPPHDLVAWKVIKISGNEKETVVSLPVNLGFGDLREDEEKPGIFRNYLFSFAPLRTLVKRTDGPSWKYEGFRRPRLEALVIAHNIARYPVDFALGTFHKIKGSPDHFSPFLLIPDVPDGRFCIAPQCGDLRVNAYITENIHERQRLRADLFGISNHGNPTSPTLHHPNSPTVARGPQREDDTSVPLPIPEAPEHNQTCRIISGGLLGENGTRVSDLEKTTRWRLTDDGGVWKLEVRTLREPV